MQQCWIFGYGSLMWRPGFEFESQAHGRIRGFHRSLCVYSLHHRGTEALPGLVLGLDRGGSCVGVAFQIVDDTLDVTGSAPKLGKEPGADLRDGTVTLPTLLAIHERPEIAASIRALDDGDAVEHVLAQIRATRGPETAGQRAQALALAAWQRISGLDPDRWNMLELRRVHDAAVQRLT